MNGYFTAVYHNKYHDIYYDIPTVCGVLLNCGSSKFTINKRRVYIYSKLESMLEYFTCQFFHKILILEKQRDWLHMHALLM